MNIFISIKHISLLVITMPIKNRHFLIICLILSFFYFSNPVSAFNIDDVNTLAINGTVTDMTFNNTNWWISDDLGFLYEFDIDFNPTHYCSVNLSSVNYVTYLYYDVYQNNHSLYGGEYSGTTGWTLPRTYMSHNPAGPLDKCDINTSGTWIGTRLYSGDAWYYNSTIDANIGQWNQPIVAAARYLHFWQLRNNLSGFRLESNVYPNFTSGFNPGAIILAADKYNAPTPTPVSLFVISNATPSQVIHKYNAISFDHIDFNLQYLIDVSLKYPDIDRIMAAEYYENASTKWLYLANNTHVFRINITEFEDDVGNNVTLLSPLDNTVLTVSEVTGKYQISIIDNVTVKVYLDNGLLNTINYSDTESGIYYEAFGNLTSNPHTWGVRLSNQTDDVEIAFPNATFTVQLSAIEEVAEGVRSALGLSDVQAGLTIMAFMIMIGVSIGAAGFMFALGGSGEGAGTGFLVTFVTSALVLGSIGWLPAWISITVIVLAGITVAVMMTKSFGGFRGG